MGRLLARVVVLGSAVVLARVCWWAMRLVFSGGMTDALWPADHLFLYTLPSAVLGAEALVLIAHAFDRAPRWTIAGHLVAIASALRVTSWGGPKLDGWRPSMSEFDRTYYFGNTVWVWLLVPVTVVLAALVMVVLSGQRRDHVEQHGQRD